MMNLNGLTKIFTGNGGTIRFAIAGVTILGIVGTVVEHNYGVSGGSGNGRFFSFHPLGAVNTRQPAPCIVDEGRNGSNGSLPSKSSGPAETLGNTNVEERIQRCERYRCLIFEEH